MLAVALVVGVIAIIGVLRGDSRPPAGGGSPVVSQPVVVTTSRTGPTPSPIPPTTSSAAPTTSAPPPPPTVPPAVVAPPPAATAVEVYNVSHRSGLAQSATNRLRHAGYHVTHVRNRIGYPLTATTVYYDPGNAVAKAAADGVVARHLGIVAAAPRPANVPATGALVVYVTSSYS